MQKEPGKVGEMTPAETEMFLQLRKDQATTMGVTAQRAGGFALLLDTTMEAKRLVADGQK